MNDIKEYFTANKHPLISRSASINQRLRAATELERRPVDAGGRAGVSCGCGQMAGDASSRHNNALPRAGHTRNLINIQHRRLDCLDAAVN